MFASQVAISQQAYKPMVIAHRGASAYAPENTLAAFRKAMEMEADALEIDVRQTKDGYLVIMHDATVDRTTNGRGRVDELTLAEVRRLDAGSSFNASFIGEQIPTLEEVLALLDSKHACGVLVVELKEGSENGSVESKIIGAVERSGKQKQVILKSFDKDVLARFKTLEPEIPRLFVYAFRIPWLNLIVGTSVSSGSVFDADVQFLQAHWYLLSQSFTQTAHEKGFKVVAWGIDDEEAMRKAIEYGVDGIETDKPDVARRIISETTNR
jgi:glycerophosphoryl diester phosphodiesterase